ncbi:Rab11 family-interacting protein 4 [Pteropus alecto]|uniref:Rab11 family-interacting protein 4 n=1 Tax=Pteropus alecto TaxID=9402 RepID=L5JSV3_PTEAL|nr:Rab11 family-interacting protein 4 [Pteropus alecto]
MEEKAGSEGGFLAVCMTSQHCAGTSRRKHHYMSLLSPHLDKAAETSEANGLFESIWLADLKIREVEKLVKYLDPNDLGRINFKDFCRGVFAMKGCEELLKDVLSVESVGTLPCAPEIPDCVEQVQEPTLG